MPFSGWTAASLVPPHQVDAALRAPVNVPTQHNTQTAMARPFVPGQVTVPDVSKDRDAILKQILGPNATVGMTSPIAGANAFFTPNYLAQQQSGKVPAPGPNGFTRFGNAYWKLPPAMPTDAQKVPGVNQTAFAPQATNTGKPSGWMPTQQNLFNI